MLKSFIILMCVIFIAPEASQARRRKIIVKGALKVELNNLLRSSSELHTGLYKQDEPLIATQLQKVLSNLKKTSLRTFMAEGQRPHIDKMLEASQINIETAQMQSGDKRRESLKQAFRQLVQIAKIYKLDRYRVFFCPKDKSVWIQKSRKPQNPIHPVKYGKCGRLVERT